MLETCVPWKGYCGFFLLIKVGCPGWQGICVNSISIAVLDVAFLFLGGVQVKFDSAWQTFGGWFGCMCVYLHETWVLKHSFATTYCMSIRFVFLLLRNFDQYFFIFWKKPAIFFCNLFFVSPPPGTPDPEPATNRGVEFVHGLICGRLLLVRRLGCVQTIFHARMEMSIYIIYAFVCCSGIWILHTESTFRCFVWYFMRFLEICFSLYYWLWCTHVICQSRTIHPWQPWPSFVMQQVEDWMVTTKRWGCLGWGVFLLRLGHLDGTTVGRFNIFTYLYNLFCIFSVGTHLNMEPSCHWATSRYCWLKRTCKL